MLKKGQVAHEAGTGSLWHILRLDHTGYAAMRKQKEVYTSMGVGSWACRRLCTHRGDMWSSFESCSALLRRVPLAHMFHISHPLHSYSPVGNRESPSHSYLSLLSLSPTYPGLYVERA